MRTTDASMQIAIVDGVGHSPFFRDLVAQINASNVVVYVESDCQMPAGVSGRLTFVTSAADLRYVLIRIACALDEPVQVAMLGHELRHAVEVADARDVVDEVSLAAEYRRIGFASPLMRGAAFDTQAAIDAGYRGRAELMRGRDRQVAHQSSKSPANVIRVVSD